MRAVGITCGIGSLLIGARQAGFEVVGNIEWRKYYHARDQHGRNTFTENFRGAFFREKIDDLTPQEIERAMEVTLAMSHPECGAYSQLSGSNADFHERRATDVSDIPLAVDLIGRLKPRYFAMDDLPKSLMAYPMQKYAEGLPDYDLFPEWISNWGYGNVQRGRNRMFMLGARRGQGWAFRPGEAEHQGTVADAIGDLPEPRRGSNWPNHDPHRMEADCARALNMGGYRRKNTWGEVREYFRDKPGGFTMEYPKEDGRVVKRIGFLKGHWEKTSHVLTGGNAIFHNKRCEPYTVRERARIQGFPDDFVFYGTILNDRGEWDHDVNRDITVKQTGKAMPIQFARYFSEQVAASVSKERFESSGHRVLPPNEHISQAKEWYCSNVGYSDQAAACSQCWLVRKCKIRRDRFGIHVAGEQTTLPV